MTTNGRNDPCPCGSGKKYKHCCMQHDAARAETPVSDPASVQSLVQAAVAHHQAGRLNDAEGLYRQVLQREPANPDALHLMGLIAHQVGQNAVAFDFMSQAIRIKPDAVMYCNLGLVLDAQGRRDLAVESFRQAISLKPEYIDAYVNLGASWKDQGKLEQAVECYRKALALKPDFAEVHFNLGVALQGQGKLDEAVESYQKALELNPRIAKACLNLGTIFKSRGKIEQAIELYRQALALNPSFGEAHYNLAVALQGRNCLDEEISHYRIALAQRPEHAEAHSNLGNALRSLGRTGEALEHYRQALMIKPDYAVAHYNLGIVLQEQNKLDEASQHYRQALELKSDYLEAHGNLAGALYAQGKLDEASRHYRQVLVQKPDDADTHCNLAVILKNQDRLDEAIDSCHQAIAFHPDHARAYAVLGNIHIDLGQFELAKSEISRALEADPENILAWALLANLRKMTPDDADWLQKALRLLEQAGSSANSEEIIALRFSIGKYYDDTRQYDLAFSAYAQGNALKRQRKSGFNRAGLTHMVDTLIATYDADFFRQDRDGASQSERPVLIAGMPRSGTSLTEQIIASHPDTFGAGELIFWARQSNAYQSIENSGNYDAALLARLATEYEHLLDHYSPDAIRVVDKMPGNFWRLGLIATVFPRARIIHTQRNPIDTCLSIHFQNFNASHTYATDLEDLVFYYREYLRIMEHWRSVLPPQRFLEVPYEKLTADQEGWSRRIIEFLGLQWDARCLNFHETERKVGTASNWQVRQKIYQTSKARWRNYEKHVGPLLDLLEPEA